METLSTPSEIAAFWAFAPPQVRQAVVVLSGAVALTDELASWLLEGQKVREAEKAEIIECLHECGFVVERNSEWQFTPEARAWLSDRLYEDPELARRVHGDLLTVAIEAQPDEAGDTVPAYLTWPAGRAYHTAAVDPEKGLLRYAEAYQPRLSGDQWLLGVLAEEQQRRGVLPASAIEPAYISGMMAYREGRWRDAEVQLQRVAGSEQRRIEVAIAQHVCGLIEANRHHRFEEAEALFLASLALLSELGDRAGETQVQHSLANLLARPRLRKRWGEAEKLYKESLAARVEMGDLHGAAIVQHSLANLLARPRLRKRWGEAEELYKKSLAALVEMGDLHGVAEVQHSLANLLARPQLSERWGEAEELYRKSLDTLLEMDDRRGVAQVSLNLAKLLAKLGEPHCLLDALHYARMSASANAALGFTAFQQQAEGLAATIESQLDGLTD